MNKLAAAIALGVALIAAPGAQADEPNLSALGLGSMKKMTQTQAKEVRGQGIIVFGGSFARIPGRAASVNGYAGTGRRIGGGFNLSFAGSRRQTVFAGGGSFAFAR